MPAIFETYQRHLRKNLAAKGHAVWPPGRVLRLGDVGLLGKGGGFDMRTNLKELGLKATVQRGQKQPMSATSQAVRQASALARAAGAVLNLPFDSEGSVLFEVSDFQHVRISNLGEIAERVLELYRADRWKRSYCLIDQIWRASSGTIIVATSSGASLEVSTGSSTTNELTLASLADVNAAGRVAVRGGEVVKVVGGRNLTPMFTCMRLNWFKSDLKPISTDVPDTAEGAGEVDEPRLLRLTGADIEAAFRGDDAESAR